MFYLKFLIKYLNKIEFKNTIIAADLETDLAILRQFVHFFFL